MSTACGGCVGSITTGFRTGRTRVCFERGTEVTSPKPGDRFQHSFDEQQPGGLHGGFLAHGCPFPG